MGVTWCATNCYLWGCGKPEFTLLVSLQVEKARNDELKHWENDPKATLALIILQDQFLRSLYKVCDKYRLTDQLVYEPQDLKIYWTDEREWRRSFSSELTNWRGVERTANQKANTQTNDYTHERADVRTQD